MQASSAPSLVVPAAGFAIQYLRPNWEQQAVESAKNYLDMGGFSRSQLHQQLTSFAAEGLLHPVPGRLHPVKDGL